MEKTPPQTRTDYIKKSELLLRLTLIIQQGWTILHVIPMAFSVGFTATQPVVNVFIPAGGLMAGPGDSANPVIWNAPIPAAQQVHQPSETMYEVGLLKTPDEPNEPCPRCSYPYPDPERIDRES